jgi:hypothetical protein
MFKINLSNLIIKPSNLPKKCVELFFLKSESDATCFRTFMALNKRIYGFNYFKRNTTQNVALDHRAYANSFFIRSVF